MEGNANFDNKTDENNTTNSTEQENIVSENQNDSIGENVQEQENSESAESNEAPDNAEFQIITGDGSEIEISPVREHLNSMKPKTHEEKSKKNIVIPEIKKIEIQEDDTNN